MFVVHFQKLHGFSAFEATKGIISEGRKYGKTPPIKTAKDCMFFTGNSQIKGFVNSPVPGIKPAITDHFEMLFRYVLNEPVNEINSGKSFYDIFVIFVPIIVKGDVLPIIFINAGGCYDGPAEIAADIFGNGFGITTIRFGVHIESVRMVFIAGSLNFFERGIQVGLQFIQESCAKSITEIGKVKVFYMSPKPVIA